MINFKRILSAVLYFLQDLRVRGSVHDHPRGGNRTGLNKYFQDAD